jgi:DNA-3-methyladenine glycosylase
MILESHFFDQFPVQLAQLLLGKVLRHLHVDPVTGQSHWLAAQIIETEAYYRTERASHSSLGYTLKRKAMFMVPGTIYMYFARGSDSLNFSARGKGNAVLIKSAYPFADDQSPQETWAIMQALNPGQKRRKNKDHKKNMRTKGAHQGIHQVRSIGNLCAGQTLLCRSLGLKVREWNQQSLDSERFYLDDVGYLPRQVIQCRRLGIARNRDAHLPFRFVDADFAAHCTSNPLTKKPWVEGADYFFLDT